MSKTKVDSTGIDLSDNFAFTGTVSGAGGGKVGQVVQTVKTDVFSTTSSSLVDVTGLTAAITPSATSSKVLVTLNLNIGPTDNTAVALFRGSTQIALGDASSNRSRSFASSAYMNTTVQMPSNTTFLDSPSSSSEVTYKVQGGAVGGGTMYFGRGGNDGDNAQHARTINVITLTEILA
jgi:hypothetical protein